MAYTGEKNMVGRVVAMGFYPSSLRHARPRRETRRASWIISIPTATSGDGERSRVDASSPRRDRIHAGRLFGCDVGNFRAVRPLNLRSGGQFMLTEKKRQDLMQEVANHFKKYPFVKDIEVIPSAYLSPRGSFANLDQIKTMYGVSVIVLLSYDQTQFTDEGALSLTYWTIVGAYLVRGEKNDTHTMLDAVVYDIPSRKMLSGRREPVSSRAPPHR